MMNPELMLAFHTKTMLALTSAGFDIEVEEDTGTIRATAPGVVAVIRLNREGVYPPGRVQRAIQDIERSKTNAG